jgi:hypothetical protein
MHLCSRNKTFLEVKENNIKQVLAMVLSSTIVVSALALAAE